MELSNSINNSNIIKSLEGLVKLTESDDIVWYHNETTPNSYVSMKCQDLTTDDLFYKLTISRKELFDDTHEYDYNLLITVIDCNGVENNHYVNKYTIKDSNYSGLPKEVNAILENLYNRVTSNVYNIENQYTADLLVKVLDSFSRYDNK